MSTDPESRRLDEARANGVAWRMWGPYLSERQWGTVREDYSHTGAAWDYFTHDHARSRAYAWGEDGLAGLCDEKQRICFALALWNGADPILKERLFGLTNSEGNHGEDVKEYYFYLDSTPTHSYMKWLYKYPHRAYPYADLVETNRRRSRRELEYELVDTGIFDDDRYFDVFVEYAKAAPDDILVHISVVNRGPEPATIHLLPTLWFRRTWSATGGDPKPSVRQSGDPGEAAVVVAWHPDLGKRWLACDRAVPLLYTENETNRQRIFGEPSQSPYVKDGIDGFVVHGKKEAVNPACDGTKVAAHYVLTIDPGATSVVKLRLRDTAPSMSNPLGSDHDEVFAARRREADQYYDAITPPAASDDERRVFRQALAGMLWSKQHYALAQDAWLAGHGANPLLDVGPPTVRNSEWFHLVNDDVISMPDKWEYPWYAAWDLAFHCVALSAVDIDFAKQQLELMVHDLYMHPNGQIPAYEWNFGDVNPPVHAWATYYVYLTEKEMRGRGDHDFLRRAFHGLMLNFNWWVNRKDRNGKNVFEGGFLGLDNIGVFDRSRPLPTGGFTSPNAHS